MGHPCDYFVKYCLARRWGEEINVVEINETLKGIGLPPYSEEQYADVISKFNPPEEFDFDDKKSRETRAFMEREKILTLWEQKEEVTSTFEILVHGHALRKHDIHLMLMGSIPHEVIAEKISSKYRMNPPLKPILVSIYAHYFWNVERPSLEDWEVTLRSSVSKGPLLDCLRCGEQQALYRAGFNPKIDFNRALKEVSRQAYFRLEAMRYAPDATSTTSFGVLSGRVLAAHEMMTAQGAGLQDQLKNFRQIMMKHNDPDIKTLDTLIDKLEGGSYSGETKASEEESEEESDG